jgi:hypothetical protein
VTSAGSEAVSRDKGTLITNKTVSTSSWAAPVYGKSITPLSSKIKDSSKVIFAFITKTPLMIKWMERGPSLFSKRLLVVRLLSEVWLKMAVGQVTNGRFRHAGCHHFVIGDIPQSQLCCLSL